jgi:hypothetical protein
MNMRDDDANAAGNCSSADGHGLSRRTLLTASLAADGSLLIGIGAPILIRRWLDGLT